MTQDVIEMARQAGFVVTYVGDPIGTNCAMIEAFAKLVAAKEREACADMVFRYISQTVSMEARGCLASVTHDIRARGEA